VDEPPQAAVVTAVKSGMISREEACSSYELSEEELLAWERAFEMYGQPSLRAVTLQCYYCRNRPPVICIIYKAFYRPW
jgi:hypothetical protein